MLVDSHAHIQDKAFARDRDEVLQRAFAGGIDKIVCVGYDIASSEQTVALAETYPDLYAVVGVHPHDASTLDQRAQERLHQLGRHPKVVAIGEIGLDFYRDLSPRDTQRQAFVAQLAVARELGKPVVIHDRDAHQEVLEILRRERGGRNGGIMHCFSGGLPLALDLIKEGFHISFAGPLTFKNARRPVEVAAHLPLERILVETDCPYLAPEPFRGKRNEPLLVKEVARKLAEIRRKPLEEIAYLTARNTRQVLALP